MLPIPRRRRPRVGPTGSAGLRWSLPLACAALAAGGCDTLAPGDPGNLVPRTVAEDPMLPAIAMNGSRFHLETIGDPDDPVIVFLHGGPGGDYRSMLSLAGRHAGYSLADDHYLVYWDQRGAGLSMRHDGAVVNIASYVHDLNTLIERFSPGRPVFLIGLSWGGMFATRYINEYPQRVAGAVLIEPGPLEGATLERLKDDMIEFNLRAEWLNDAAWHTQFLSPDDHARLDFDRMLGARDGMPKYHLSRTNPEPGWRMGAAANRYIVEDGQDRSGKFTYDFTTNLAAYTTPVLFIAGAWSEVLGASLQEKQVLEYPTASLVVVDGAGHDVAWVKTPEVLTHIRTYLEARKGGDA